MITSDLTPPGVFRVRMAATAKTGLRENSEIMAEEVSVALRSKCGSVFGRAPDGVLAEPDEALAFILGLGEQTSLKTASG